MLQNAAKIMFLSSLRPEISNFEVLYLQSDSDKKSFILCHFLNLLLLQRSLLPGGIILQGVLLFQGSMSVFACHYG
jgi:hypothetical protein